MSYTNSNDKAYAEWAYEFGTEEHTPEPEERRDYCAEAHSIAMGESNLLAERAHIVALREEIDYFEAQVRDLKKQNEMLRASHPAFAAARKANASALFEAIAFNKPVKEEVA